MQNLSDLYLLSQMNSKNFSLAVNDLFLHTLFNEEQYPNYLEWYYTKNIPRVKMNEGEGMFSLDGYVMKGLIFTKFDEKKICTLYVDEDYRCNGLGQKLLERSFTLLGTDKPLITIPEHKIHQFDKFIKAYHWQETAVTNDYFKKEIIFNGK